MTDIKVRVGSQNALKVISSLGGSGILSGLDDVSISGDLLDGMVLVYNSTTSKWESVSGSVQNGDVSIIDGGPF
jgi:hypothetical protein